MNFNGNDEVVVSTGKAPLMPFAVHTVKFDGVEISDGGTYKLMKLNFSNDEGSLRMSIFRPNERDEERREGTRQNGTKFYYASNAENMWACFQQLMKALNPEGYEKAKAVKIKNFDDAFALVEKVLKGVVGAETSIKVEGYMKNGYVTYRLPNITTLVDSTNAKSDTRQNDYFIGEKVFLTNYNMTQAAKFQKEYEAARSAAPTPMAQSLPKDADASAVAIDLNTPAGGSEDIDLANLDL